MPDVSDFPPVAQREYRAKSSDGYTRRTPRMNANQPSAPPQRCLSG